MRVPPQKCPIAILQADGERVAILLRFRAADDAIAL